MGKPVTITVARAIAKLWTGQGRNRNQLKENSKKFYDRNTKLAHQLDEYEENQKQQSHRGSFSKTHCLSQVPHNGNKLVQEAAFAAKIEDLDRFSNDDFKKL